MNKAQTITFTPEQVKDQATVINKKHDTNITVFCEGDFNNYAYIDVDGDLKPIAQGSLSAVYRALGTFELAFTIGVRSARKEPDLSAKIAFLSKVRYLNR